MNPQLIKQKLESLNESQNSIETISQWIIFHRKNCNLIVELWTNELKSTTDSKRKLLLFYLANDVMQNSRKKYGNELVECFGRVMLESFVHCWNNGVELRSKFMRLLDIWKERSVFDSVFISRIKSHLSSSNSSSITTTTTAVASATSINTSTTTTATNNNNNNNITTTSTNDLSLLNKLASLQKRRDALQPILQSIQDKNPNVDLKPSIASMMDYIKDSTDLRQDLILLVQDIDKQNQLISSLIASATALLSNKKDGNVDESRDPRRKRALIEEPEHEPHKQQNTKEEDEEYDPFAT